MRWIRCGLNGNGRFVREIAVLFELAVAKSGFQMFCFVCRGLKYTHFRVIKVED